MPDDNKPMAGMENLKKGTPFTADTAREYGARGGGSKKRKDNRILNNVLAMSIRDGDIKTSAELQSLAEANGVNMSVELAMYLIQVKQALNGSTKAWEALMRYVDQREKRSYELRKLKLDIHKQELEIEALKRALNKEDSGGDAVKVIIDV